MNLKDIEYIVTIAEEKRLSKAAEKLFVTPSALTQQLSNLEREIGTPLFYRARGGWIPTEAGQIYLQSAQKILQIRQETYKRLQDIVDTHKGTLTIGFTPEHGSPMFTAIYPTFHRRYPEIVINIREANVRSQQQMISSGELDLGILTVTDDQRTDDEYIPLNPEEIVLAIPSIHPACQLAHRTKRSFLPELELSQVQYEPFALMYRQSTMYELISKTFEEAGFNPTILFDTLRSVTALNMVDANICCSLVPDFFARKDYSPPLQERVLFLRSRPSHLADCRKLQKRQLPYGSCPVLY